MESKNKRLQVLLMKENQFLPLRFLKLLINNRWTVTVQLLLS
jgi:hypothetical protein